MAVDLLIENGTIVDGTGGPGRPGSVAVVGDSLRILGTGAQASGAIGRRIDATGKVIAPGFIDVHSHSGLWLLAGLRVFVLVRRCWRHLEGRVLRARDLYPAQRERCQDRGHPFHRRVGVHVVSLT